MTFAMFKRVALGENHKHGRLVGIHKERSWWEGEPLIASLLH